MSFALISFFIGQVQSQSPRLNERWFSSSRCGLGKTSGSSCSELISSLFGLVLCIASQTTAAHSYTNCAASLDAARYADRASMLAVHLFLAAVNNAVTPNVENTDLSNQPQPNSTTWDTRFQHQLDMDWTGISTGALTRFGNLRLGDRIANRN